MDRGETLTKFVEAVEKAHQSSVVTAWFQNAGLAGWIGLRDRLVALTTNGYISCILVEVFISEGYNKKEQSTIEWFKQNNRNSWIILNEPSDYKRGKAELNPDKCTCVWEVVYSRGCQCGGK